MKSLWVRFVKHVIYSMGLRSARGHHFHPRGLAKGSMVVDLGAHKGEFATFVATTYGCSVIGVEANPALYRALNNGERIQFFNAAICSTGQRLNFYVSENLESSSIFSEVAGEKAGRQALTVEGITLESLLARNQIGQIGLLKVDIEGAEYEMLESATDATLQHAAQITVEFHPIGSGPVESRARVRAIGRRLGWLGYRMIAIDRNFADVLFFNPSRVGATYSEDFFYLVYRAIICPIRALLSLRS